MPGKGAMCERRGGQMIRALDASSSPGRSYCDYCDVFFNALTVTVSKLLGQHEKNYSGIN